MIVSAAAVSSRGASELSTLQTLQHSDPLAGREIEAAPVL